MHGGNGFAGLGGSTEMDANRMALHRRARAAATTTSETSATSHSATVRAAAKATAVTTAPVQVAAAAATSATFQPGVAASGTATKSVGNAPPTRTKNLNTIPLESYSVSFATQQTAGYSAPHSAGGVAVGPISAPASAPPTTGLSKTAIYGIIAGGAALGLILLAVIGVCCWKRKKAKNDDLGWTNLGDKGGGGGRNGIAMLDNPNRNGASAWASTDSFAGGPYASEKPWAQQSFGSLAATDAKPAPHGHLPSSHHVLPAFSSRNNEPERAELFALPRGQLAHEYGVARSATHDSLASSALPFAPPPPIGRLRSNSNAQSVNDVIRFPGEAQAVTNSPPSHAPDLRRPPPVTAASSPPRQQSFTSPIRHLSLSGVAVGPQPITAAYFRPPRPSEVPSVPSSPYALSRRPEVQSSARDTQEIKRDQEVEQRFLEVMTGQVGRDEGSHEGERQRSKKDTIVGLTEVYGGEGGEEWEQDNIDGPAKAASTAPALLPRRSSSRKRTQATPSSAAPLPSAPPPAAVARSSPPLSNPNRYSTRVDSKPLRELEELFDRLPPVPPREARLRASEASDYSAMAAHVGGGSGGVRHSDASSLGPYASQSTVPTNGLSFTRRPLGTVPESDSKDSLAPLTASGPQQCGAHGPYGEASRYEHSIRSAAGEVGELSSSSIASGNPVQSVLRTPVGTSPLSTPKEERALDAGEDVFGGGGTAPAGFQRKAWTRPSAPTPIRLARNASLGTGHKQPTAPLDLPESARDPLTLSAAERDVLHALELPPSSLSYSPLSSGERTPDLSSSIGSSSSFATPQTPSFSFSPAPARVSDSPTSFLDAAPSPSTSPTANKATFSFPGSRTRGHEVEVVDPLVARGGFESLDAMRSGKNVDQAYRSATMSLYGMYE